MLVLPYRVLSGTSRDAFVGPGRVALPRARESAHIRGLATHVYEMRQGEDIVPAVERAAGDGRSAMVVMNSPILGRADIAVAALRARLPLFGYDWTTRAGGLASVTPDFRDVAQTMATHVAAILAGRLADDIPLVEQGTFWTAVNIVTAERLGVSVPDAVLARANEVVR